MGDASRSFEKVSPVMRGGLGGWLGGWNVDCWSSSSLEMAEMGYLNPNSAKYQSGMSVVDISPTDITGLRRATAEKKSGNCPITINKKRYQQDSN